jgi:hypothetical protein
MEAGLKRGHSKINQDSSSYNEGFCSDETKSSDQDEDVEEEPHTCMKVARASASPVPSTKKMSNSKSKSKKSRTSGKAKDQCNAWAGTPMDTSISRFMNAVAIRYERENEEYENRW